MSMWIGAGSRFNLIENAVSITPSTAADALFPTSNLYDRNPASIFKFGSITASPTLTFDFDPLGGTGDFESWSGGAPVGWTEASTGTGDVTQEAVIVNSGASSAELTPGASGFAGIYKDITVRSGPETSTGISVQYSLRAALRGDGGIGQAQVEVQNLATKKYLKPDGTWQTGQISVMGRTTASWATSEVPFLVEPFSVCLVPEVTLRILVKNVGLGSTAFADSIDMQPNFNFLSVHGHNIEAGIVVTVRGSTDNFSASNVLLATCTLAQPSFWAILSALGDPVGGATYRYLRILFTGTQSSSATWLGEVTVGRALRMATGPLYPFSLNHLDTQIRVAMRWGTQAYGLGQAAVQTFPFTLQPTTVAQWNEYLREVFIRSRGGIPVTVVPHDASGFTDVIYGRLATELPHEWGAPTVSKVSGTIEELPFPFITS